jgi:hypothetical protein
MPGAPILGAR